MNCHIDDSSARSLLQIVYSAWFRRMLTAQDAETGQSRFRGAPMAYTSTVTDARGLWVYRVWVCGFD